jgi:hypothetical protein
MKAIITYYTSADSKDTKSQAFQVAVHLSRDIRTGLCHAKYVFRLGYEHNAYKRAYSADAVSPMDRGEGQAPR